jgi:hypothetical protein
LHHVIYEKEELGIKNSNKNEAESSTKGEGGTNAFEIAYIISQEPTPGRKRRLIGPLGRIPTLKQNSKFSN